MTVPGVNPAISSGLPSKHDSKPTVTGSMLEQSLCQVNDIGSDASTRFCRVCRSQRIERQFSVRERMFGLAGQFVYTLCAECGSLSRAANEADISHYYPKDYYSFAASNGFPSTTKTILRVGRRLPEGLITWIARLTGSYSMTVLMQTKREIAHWGGPPQPHILDVGCGAGEHLLRYHYAGCYIEGLDPFYAGPDPAECPIHRVPLAAIHGRFDVITFRHSLEHLPEPVGVLKQCVRLLSTGGVCVVTTPKLPSAAFDKYGESWFALDAPRHYFIPSVNGFRNMADRAGFREVISEEELAAATFVWSEAYRRGFIYHGCSIESILGEAEREALQAEAVAAYHDGRSCHGVFLLRK